MPSFLSSCTCPTLLLIAASMAAQDAPDSATTPWIIEVNASRLPTSGAAAALAAATAEVHTTPGGAAVIAGETIQRGRTATWRDLLQTTPGVIVQPRFGAEEARLSIRGSGIQRTFHLRGIALLQDGIPINQADGGGDFQATDPALADRVEVFRGANALQYGASNLGGAINVVSPTGLTQPGARVRLEGGSFGYAKAVVSGGFADQRLDGWFGATLSTVDGYRDHSAQRNQRLFANLGWQLSDQVENRVFVAYTRSDSELPGAVTAAQLEADPTQANPAAVLRDQKRDYPLYRVADRLRLTWGERQLDLGLGYARKELFHPLQFLPNGFGFSGGPLIEQDSDDLAASVRFRDATPVAGRGNRVVAGANVLWGRTNGRQSGYSGATGHDAGPLYNEAVQTAREVQTYAEVQHEAVRDWWLIAGVQLLNARRELDDRFQSDGDQSAAKTWTALNPKVGVRWDALRSEESTVQVFANLSRSAEPPSFAEYVQGIKPPQALDDLAAQRAWTAEIGTRGTWLDGARPRITWDVAAYQAWVGDELLQYTDAGQTFTRNAERTTHAGIELGITVVPLSELFASRDQVVVSQIWNWSRFRFADDAAYGSNQLAGLPAHTWRGEVRYERDGWYGGIVLEWQDGWPVNFQNTVWTDSAFLVGLRVGYRAGRGFSAFIEGRNLGDVTYAATSDVTNSTAPTPAAFYPGDGRSVVAGAEWSW